MLEKKLHSGWMMRAVSEIEYMEALVPGSVYADYERNGRMDNPYYRDNELKALELMKQDFEYKTCFDAEEELLAKEEVILHFDGIDTIADIWLNGIFLGHADNMHRIWEFHVKKILKPAGNELKILLASPVGYIYDSYERDPLIVGSVDAMRGCPRIRKAHCMYGWDWGARLPDAGIWREVKLLGVGEARLNSVYITQKHTGGRVMLTFQNDVEAAAGVSNKKYFCKISVTGPNGEVIAKDEITEHITVEEPQLWWPSGYGNQPLYEVTVKLCKDQLILDEWKKRVGLRTMKMIREKDQWGECFCHEVNGVRIFAMGADYIPEEHVLPWMSPEKTYDLLLQAKNAHFNCIRVWGGGHYPYDAFWDACDELGLMVWQDFMFACCVYDLTEEFEENIKAELADNIKRIRHHASLALWCGNNEMELFLEENPADWCLKPSQFSDYIKMYEYIIPRILKKYDPQTFYWPASPSSGGSFDEPNDENRGDVHYWDVWHGNKPITEFRKFYFRYVSEFGFQSFPALKTVETFTMPEDRNIFSYVMEKHQRNQSANGKIMNYMEQTFLYPGDFDTILYASQLLQAEAMRYGVEHFRRNRGRCMGTIIWQFNDCWPVASWSMIDHAGRWKAVQYYAKRFFAPLMLSCEEEGLLSQDSNVNAEPYELKKSIRLCVANETRIEQKGTVTWQLRDASGRIKREECCKVCVDALSSYWMDRVYMQDADTYGDYVCYELETEAGIVSEGSILFSPPKHFRFENPKLRAEAVSDSRIQITADTYAKGIEIRNEEDTLLLEDNYFDMNPGTKIIQVLKGELKGLQIRSIYDIR